MKNNDINIFRLDFIDETKEQTVRILEDLSRYRSSKNAFKGNYYKPVE